MKNFARIVPIIWFSLTCANVAVARNWFEETYLKLTRNYAEIYAGENYQSIAELRSARGKLWQTRISTRKKIAITHAMHDGMQPFLQTADDYIKLLEQDHDFPFLWAQKVSNDFIEKNLDNFFATGPSFTQVMAYQECATDLRVSFMLRREALAFAATASDVIAVTKTTWDRGNNVRDRAMLNFIHELLPEFKKHKPSLHNIATLERQVDNLLLPIQEKHEVYFAMKKLFLDSFHGEELFEFLELDYVVHEEYGDMRAKLIADNLDQILRNLQNVKQFHKIEKFLWSATDRLKVKEAGLAHVKKPQDFFTLMKPTFKTRSFRTAVVALVSKSIHVFAALNPNVQHLKDLRKLLTTLYATNVDLIVVLSAFIKDFHDDDLVKLLQAFKFDYLREYNLDEIASRIRARDVRRIEKFHTNYAFGLTLRNKLLPGVDAKNFVKLMRSQRTEKKFNEEINAMIAGQLTLFKSLNPTVDDVLDLKIVIDGLAMPQEKLVGTKLKLIDTFWDSFSGLEHAQFIAANDQWMIGEISKLRHVNSSVDNASFYEVN